jgi:hypothetical protein
VAAFLEKISTKLSVLIPQSTINEPIDEHAFASQLRTVFEQLESLKLRHALLAGFDEHTDFLWKRYQDSQGSADTTAALPSKKRRRDAGEKGDELSPGAERLHALVATGRSPLLVAANGSLRSTSRSFDPEQALAQLSEAVAACREMTPSAASVCALSAFLTHYTFRLASTAPAPHRTHQHQLKLTITLLLRYLHLYPPGGAAVSLDVGAFVEQCHVVLGALGEEREGSIALLVALVKEASTDPSNRALALVIDRGMQRLSRTADMGTPLSSEHFLRVLLPFAVLQASPTSTALAKSLTHLNALPIAPPLIAYLKEHRGTAAPTVAGVLRLQLSPIELSQALAELSGTPSAAVMAEEEEEEEDEGDDEEAGAGGGDDGAMDDLFFVDHTGTSELSGSIAGMIKDMPAPAKKVAAGAVAVVDFPVSEEEEEAGEEEEEGVEANEDNEEDDEDDEESGEEETVQVEAPKQMTPKRKSPSLARSRPKRAGATPDRYGVL